jgi:GNAT superfamily N-acetyltransferase
VEQSKSDFPRWEPLGKQHDRAAFECPEHRELAVFLQQHASQHARRHIAATTVVLVDSDSRVAGYYTLSSARVDLTDLPPELLKKYPSYAEGVPATLVGRLAVDKSYRGGGWGRRLLMHALQTALAASGKVASAFVIVRAKDDDARRFYMKYGFREFTGDKYRLFMPMATVAALPSR